MRKLIGVLLALGALSLVAVDADARRMSGGKSIGKQREALNPNQAAPRTPPQQQQQAAPAQQQQAAKAAPPAQQPSGMSRWLGPLAGLALGAGLAALFFNNGLGGALLGILLIAALVAGAVLLVRLFRGSRPAQQPLRYAGATPYERREPVAASIPPAFSGAATGAAAHSVAATTQSEPSLATRGELPAGFDAEQFVRHARTNFMNLQSAYDQKDLNTIRDFLTPELYREIEADVRVSGNALQKTDIVTLDAEVLDVATENGSYVVSVRFTGLTREEPATQPEPFTEIWHLEKPVNGRSGWLVSGIQQV
jgi:predicted lipid-binding transport protein (Tim44 family)